MPELGTKYDCYNCGTKFYDLGKPEPLCPKCAANQNDVDRGDAAGSSSTARKRRKADIPKPIEVEDDVPIEDLPPDEEIGAVLDGDAEEEEEDFDDDDEA
jgi:predicted  nucleic acid-binding Zn-ribbon protein